MKTELAIASYLDRHGYSVLDVGAVFFDMDGVLFNSMPYHAAAWMRVLSEYGIPFGEHDAYMNEGRTGASTICEYFKKHKGRKPTDMEIRDIYAKKSLYFREISRTEKIPHVGELLTMLKHEDKKIYVVTGSGQKSLIETLDLHFPEIFEREKMVTAYDVKIGKPDPEPYLMALRKADVTADKAVVVENSPLGVKSGSAAGIFTIAVNTGKLSDSVLYSYGADVVFPDMESLIKEYGTIFKHRDRQ